jgi:hypothetical protein
LAYYNTTRDGEYLVKGSIPATYLRGPYSAKAGELLGTEDITAAYPKSFKDTM